MPRIAEITEEHLAYLRQASKNGVSYSKMARHIGVCTDTCKRILHKNGIVEFQAAKYIVAKPLHPAPATWSRPCMTCGDLSPRPKFQYRCDRCHEREDAGLPPLSKPSRPPRPQPSPTDILHRPHQRLPQLCRSSASFNIFIRARL